MWATSFPTTSDLAAASGSLHAKIQDELQAVAHRHSLFTELGGAPSWHGQEDDGTVWIKNNYAPVVRCASALRISNDNGSTPSGAADFGGKWLCSELLQSQNCTLLSIGIDGNTDFDLGIFRRFGCEIQ